MKIRKIGKWSASEIRWFIGYVDVDQCLIDEYMEEFLLSYTDDFALETEAKECFWEFLEKKLG